MKSLQTMRAYCKPNFSNHPLNHIALIIVLLGSFFTASLAQAEERRYYYAEYSISGGGMDAASGCEKSVNQISWKRYVWNGSSCRVKSDSGTDLGYARIYSDVCGTGTRSQICDQSVNDCPEYGTVKFTLTAVNGEIHELEDGTKTFIPKDAEGNTFFTVGDSGSADGCGYFIPVTQKAREYVKGLPEESYNCHDSGVCFRRAYMIATGEPSSESEESSENIFRALDTDKTKEINEGNKDNRKDTTDTVIEDPIIVNNPDGSSSRTDKKTVTSVNGNGQKVTETTETVTITDSKGITKVVTEVTNEVTQADGSKTVTTDKTTSYTGHPVTNYTIDRSTGTATVSTTGGSSASSSTRTTETYDADGNKTGISTESSSDGEGDAKEEQEKDACKEDPASCEDNEFEKPDKGTFDSGEANSELIAAKAELQAKYDEIKDEVEDLFDFNISGSGGELSDLELSWRGETVSQTNNLTGWFDYLNMASLILLLAALISLLIILRGSNKGD